MIIVSVKLLAILFLCSLSLVSTTSFGQPHQRAFTTRTTNSINNSVNHETLTNMEKKIALLQSIIGADAGGRGMKNLIVPGDLYQASRALGRLAPSSTTLILSGFPCCVSHNPPTETDGPPGTMAIARASVALGHRAVVVVDDCNKAVFQACLDNLALPAGVKAPELQSFPPAPLSAQHEARFQQLAQQCDLLISCERAGPAKDGICYTMRGIDMNAAGLIAPLHRFVEDSKVPFIAIGDGGNELGMGKVLDSILKHITNAEKIACVVPANYLIAAGVSNWGGYALAAGAALCRVEQLLEEQSDALAKEEEVLVADWLSKCLPTAQEETELLNRGVAAGCRDGVSGQMEATVDGMPLETSLQCLRDIEAACLKKNDSQ